MKDYFFDRVAETISADKAGHRFIAVTDPGSVAGEGRDQAGLCPHLPRRPTIGGRYSVLSPFGLVPAGDRRHRCSHA